MIVVEDIDGVLVCDGVMNVLMILDVDLWWWW